MPGQVRIFQPGVQNAVDQQVRITADGRSEMTVILCRQTEMAYVFRLVHRLAHAAQGHGVYQPFFRPLFHFRQSVLHILGPHLAVFGNAQLHVKALQQFCQPFHLIFRRNFVDPVHTRPLEHSQMPGHGLVGRQHKFFDDGFRQAVDALPYLQRLARFI